MKDRDRLVISSLMALMLVLWLGFLFHQSPRFAGSLWGGVLGVSGALLMLWPLGYSFVKRVPRLKAAVTRRVSMKSLLTWHVYTGVLGAILAVLHTGHKFDNPVAVALTVVMFAAVLSGYIGRYFLNLLSLELRERQDTLTQLRAEYQKTAAALALHPMPVLVSASNWWQAWAFALGWPRLRLPPEQRELALRAWRLSESIADLEYAIGSDDLIKRRFSIWLWIHIGVSALFYALLAWHVWAGFYYGLRWFKP